MGILGAAAGFADILCHTFAISGVLYSRGVAIGIKDLRKEQKHIKNNYLNDDLAAFALPVDSHKSGVCLLFCSEIRKFSAWPCTMIPNLRKTLTDFNPGITKLNLQKLVLLESDKEHLFFHKAIANCVQRMKAR